MKDWKIYQEKLKRNVNTISISRNLEFAIEICKRLLPEYIDFEKKHNWGNPNLIIKGIEICEESTPIPTDRKKIKDLIQKLNSVVPDTEEFGDLSSSLALNSACAIIETLTYLIDFDSKHIFNVGNYMYDTIDFKTTEKPNLKDEIKWQLNKTKNELKEEPIWTVVANIVEERPYGPNGKEIKIGTKYFKPGAKVYIIDWHPGTCESIIVIGMVRKSKKFIRITIKITGVENLRIKMAYNPTVIEKIQEHHGAEQTYLTEEFVNKMSQTIPLWQEEMKQK